MEVIWKLLDVTSSNPPTNPGDCEKEFNEDNLRKKNKEPLACTAIPSQVLTLSRISKLTLKKPLLRRLM